MTEETTDLTHDTSVIELKQPTNSRLQELQAELQARANALVAADPRACRILGKIEMLQELSRGSTSKE